eukprot:CAMPEP_0197836650 /NCGR_PEP_ID=MMETSP1437-20131217/29613_1 /TAXON_ID=49252 ORGANISM="Eucampia antarctica, Strain CCMP1452" /NCGR_SAMPLE_ID=MMETSP1437 /ASSEMBLY_ACC=CAM_ASM_001096 /LENGTH=498 /DNA_ID=CAMNT_0043442991 /DNA_START=9 /DNA_END=1505 /DNA_ORIENTATION=+
MDNTTGSLEDKLNEKEIRNPLMNTLPRPERTSREIFRNFLLLSSLFSTNHAAAVSCLSLASARLGSNIGTWQSGTLYISYTASALLGSTYVTKVLGARNGLALGMSLYCIYVASFILSIEATKGFSMAIAVFGGLLGGAAAGIMWTSQGSYFALTCEEYKESLTSELRDSSAQDQLDSHESTRSEDITSKLGGLFATILLAGEVIWRLFSTVAVQYLMLSWKIIFVVYLVISIVSAVAMVYVYEYRNHHDDVLNEIEHSPWDNITVTGRLLMKDRKMKYMIPLCAVFGFSSSFILSFVNGEALKISALKDTKSVYVGVFSSLTSGVAGIMSLAFGYGYKYVGKGVVLTLGSLAFFTLSFLFLVINNPESWSWGFFISIYSLQGFGRATYEGALRSRFADFFAYEKTGAFANFVLFNGTSSSIGFIIGIFARCVNPSRYCIQYMDSSVHNVLVLEVLIMVFSVLAVMGYYRATTLYSEEKETRNIPYNLPHEENETIIL